MSTETLDAKASPPLAPGWNDARRLPGSRRSRRRWIVLAGTGVVVIAAAMVIVAVTSNRGVNPAAAAAVTPQIRPVVAAYLNLQQSVLVPNTDGSSNWPSVEPQGPIPANTHVTVPVVYPAEEPGMVTAATKAIYRQETPSAQREFDYWIKGALGTVAHDDNWPVSAGERIQSFKIVALTPTTATVVVTAEDWQETVSSAGTVNHLVVEEHAGLDLVRVDNRWLVNDFIASTPL